MILEHEMTMIGSRGQCTCNALFDSGASYSIIRPDIAELIAEYIPLANPENWIFETAIAGTTMQATNAVRLDCRFDDSKANFSDEFIVLPGCAEDVIIGATTMQKWGIKLDFESEVIHYRKTQDRLRLICLGA